MLNQRNTPTHARLSVALKLSAVLTCAVAADVLAFRMVDVQVGRELAPGPAVGRQFVGHKNSADAVHVVEHEGRDGFAGCVRPFAARARPWRSVATVTMLLRLPDRPLGWSS